MILDLRDLRDLDKSNPPESRLISALLRLDATKSALAVEALGALLRRRRDLWGYGTFREMPAHLFELTVDDLRTNADTAPALMPLWREVTR